MRERLGLVRSGNAPKKRATDVEGASEVAFDSRRGALADEGFLRETARTNTQDGPTGGARWIGRELERWIGRKRARERGGCVLAKGWGWERER